MDPGSPAATLEGVSTFDDRRRARAEWPIRRASLREEPLTDERIPDDPDARLVMLAELTRTQWAMAGRELPTYTRAEMPGVIHRPR
jgi:hypothetical protein